MSTRGKFWIGYGLFLAAITAAIFVLSPGREQREETPAPPVVVIQPETPPADAPKFQVGNVVMVDGLTDLQGNALPVTIMSIGEIEAWMDTETEVVSVFRTYTVLITTPFGTQSLNVPEIVIKKQ